MRCAAAVFRIPQALKEKPDVLDRLSFFPLLRETMSELFIDILKKNSCDVAFVQLVEEAKLRFSRLAVSDFQSHLFMSGKCQCSEAVGKTRMHPWRPLVNFLIASFVEGITIDL